MSGFSCVIFGSRNVTHPGVLDAALRRSGWAEQITEVVSGLAAGADLMGKAWAEAHQIPVAEFDPDWTTIPPGTPAHLIGRRRDGVCYYKRAGHIRNSAMLRHVYVRGGGALGLWDCSEQLGRKGSKGTADMVKKCRLKLPEDKLFVYTADMWLADRRTYEKRPR